MNRSFAVAAGAVAIVIAVVGAALLIRPGTSNVATLPSAAPTPLASTATSLASPSSPATPGISTSPSPAMPLGIAIVGIDGTVRQTIDLPNSAWAPSLSRDGRQVAYVDGGRLMIAAVDGSTGPVDTGATVSGQVPGFGTFPVDAAPAWSPDGTRIAYVSNGDIYVLTVGGTAQPRRLTTSSKLDEWPAWSPDGQTVYYVNAGATPLDDSGISRTSEVWKVAAGGGAPKRVTNDDVADLQPDISPTGNGLVWQDGGVTALNTRTGQYGNIKGSVGSIPDGWNPRWSPDGKKIAVLVIGNGRSPNFGSTLPIPTGFPLMDVVVVDLANGRTTVGPRVQAFWNPVTWTPDSQSLLIPRFDGGGG